MPGLESYAGSVRHMALSAPQAAPLATAPTTQTIPLPTELPMHTSPTTPTLPTIDEVSDVSADLRLSHCIICMNNLIDDN